MLLFLAIIRYALARLLDGLHVSSIMTISTRCYASPGCVLNMGRGILRFWKYHAHPTAPISCQNYAWSWIHGLYAIAIAIPSPPKLLIQQSCPASFQTSRVVLMEPSVRVCMILLLKNPVFTNTRLVYLSILDTEADSLSLYLYPSSYNLPMTL